MAKRGKFRRADHRAIGSDITLAEADAVQETLQGCVAVAQQSFAVETTANFVNETRREAVGIGKRDRMVSTIVLRETEPGEGRDHGRCRAYLG